jgi:beta-lactamase superfamily II metal-dependent hydrolase
MVGLSGCLLLPVLPSVGYAAMQVSAVPAEWIALVAHGVAGLPAARVPWLADAGGALLLAAGTAAIVWLLLAGRRPRWLLHGTVAVLLLAIAIPLGVAVGGPAVRRAGVPGHWWLAACDVGQGDAVLLRSSASVALIDTGPDEAALARCLDLVGVGRIDLLVLTHWDADHVAATAVLGGRVGTVVHGPLDGARSAHALAPLVDGGAEAREVVAGARGTLGDAEWRVLWPPPGREPGNDASVVLDVRARESRSVFLGDLGEAAQAELLRRGRVGTVDLVKVAHHGSADQSAALYDWLGADVGVIGVGDDNGYGHPTSPTLELLEADGTAIVRTDLTGTAVLSTDDAGDIRLWTERSAALTAARTDSVPGSGGGVLRWGAGEQVAHGGGEAPRPAERARGDEVGTAETLPAGADGGADVPLHGAVDGDLVAVETQRLDGRLVGATHAGVSQELGSGSRCVVGHPRGRQAGRQVGGRQVGGLGRLLGEQRHGSSDRARARCMSPVVDTIPSRPPPQRGIRSGPLTTDSGKGSGWPTVDLGGHVEWRHGGSTRRRGEGRGLREGRRRREGQGRDPAARVEPGSPGARRAGLRPRRRAR